MYVIVSIGEETLYWNNEWGWGDYYSADIFSAEEKKRLNLPIGGVWTPKLY